MALDRCAFLLIILAVPAQLQNTTTVVPKVAAREYAFIEFRERDNRVDIFAKGSMEYIIINQPLSFRNAEMNCIENYQGFLALLKNYHLAKFIAVALSETRLALDTVWVGGKREKNGSLWQWEKFGTTQRQNITQDILDLMVINKDIQADDRNCLGFGRLDQDDPQFRPIACNALRPHICERPRGIIPDGNSTHKGWIRLGKRLYKIFNEMVTYDEGANRCFSHDPEASLAVITNFNYCQQLGRYLLIGRPSLENAWIGARWKSNNYTFEPEPQVLPSKTNATTHFPPWRKQQVQKPYGCLLLDRHLENITLFVEASCFRKRPIICYKMFANKSALMYDDVIIGSWGYRLHLTKKNWEDSRDFCKNHYKEYGSKLVEIDVKLHSYNLLYVMGENRTAVRHIWIGGKMIKHANGAVWVWDSSEAEIPKDASLLNWVKNYTYTSAVEDANICLNMDRENHVTPMHYGARCSFKQPFVCLFKSTELIRLEMNERTAALD